MVVYRALGCVARRGAACTPWFKCGSRPGSMTGALGVQSRKFWQVTTGAFSDESQPTRSVENPQYSGSDAVETMSLPYLLSDSGTTYTADYLAVLLASDTAHIACLHLAG